MNTVTIPLRIIGENLENMFIKKKGMKVYVIFREEWDYSCLEDKDFHKDVFGVFTNKDDVEKAVMKLNEKEKYVVRESSEFAIKGLNYYIQECETDKIYNIED